MQKFVAEESFWELFPQASIGVVVARGMKGKDEVPASDAAEIARLLSDANERAKAYLTSETISENAPVKVWREAYRLFKTKKGARCSLENLLKRVLKDNPVGSITPAVDVYNAISLKHALPVGGEDLDAVAGDLRLGITEGGDAFAPLGEDEDDPTLPGELCYRDDEGAVCRCFNCATGSARRSRTARGTRLLVVECLEPERAGDLNVALDEFADLMERYLGATIAARAVVDREPPELVVAE